MEFEYEGLKDHVAPAELSQYLTTYEKMENFLSYGIQTGNEGNGIDKSGVGTPSRIYTLLTVIVIAAGLIWRVKRKSNSKMKV
jgi:hypothetical protein